MKLEQQWRFRKTGYCLWGKKLNAEARRTAEGRSKKGIDWEHFFPPPSQRIFSAYLLLSQRLRVEHFAFATKSAVQQGHQSHSHSSPRHRAVKVAFYSLCSVFVVNFLSAAPTWKTPDKLPFGELSILEIREEDPAQPPLPRPGDEKLGPLALRGVEPTPDGRGWQLTVQPMVPGTAVVPPVNFGDGRQSPELRLQIPRTVPFQAPWVGVGGGQGDVIPYIPFPWAWVSLLLLPLATLGWWLWRRWGRAAPARSKRHARHAFAHHWPPLTSDRQTLDSSHAAGRDLLAAHFGEEARSWGTHDFKNQHLEVWATWAQSLDAARFSRKDPPFPPLNELFEILEERR